MILLRCALAAAMGFVPGLAAAQSLPLSLRLEGYADEDDPGTGSKEAPSRVGIADLVEGQKLLKAGEFEAAEQVLERFLGAQPDNLQALLGRARARCELGRFEQSEGDFLRCLELAPDLTPLYLATAFLYQKWERYQTARTYMAEFVSRSPEDGYALNALGVLDLRCGKLRTAKRHFEDAVRVQPDWRVPALNAALVELRLGWASRAADALAEICQEDVADELPEARVALAESLLELHLTEAALDHLGHVVELEGEEYAAIRSLAQRHLGNHHAQRGEWERALRCFEESILLGEQLQQSVLDDLGILYRDHGKVEEGAALLRLAVMVEDRHCDRLAYARALERLDRREQALLQLRDSYATGLRQPAFLARLSRLEEETGDPERAVRAFGELLAVGEEQPAWASHPVYLALVSDRALSSRLESIRSAAPARAALAELRRRSLTWSGALAGRWQDVAQGAGLDRAGLEALVLGSAPAPGPPGSAPE